VASDEGAISAVVAVTVVGAGIAALAVGQTSKRAVTTLAT